MLRDADIAHADTYRRHLIAGPGWNLTPRNEASEFAELAVTVGTELLGGIKHFGQARFNLGRAVLSGSRFARIHSTPRVMTIGDGRPRTWLIPTRLEDMDKRMFRIVPKVDGEHIEAHWERWSIGGQKWKPETPQDATQTIRHVYHDDQASLSHGRGLREALGWIWYTKTHILQESVQACEKHAQGTIHVKVDMLRDADTGLTNDVLVQNYIDTIEDMRSRHILVTDAADTVEILPGNAEGWQLLDQMEKKLRSSVMTLYLGANLTTSANEGGSFALAQVQENSTEALVQYDRETLEETLTDDLLGAIWFRNHANLAELGIALEKPRFVITKDKRQDPKERAEVAATMHSMGAPIALDDLYEQTGFRKPEEGEDVLEGAVPPPAFGGGIPGFDTPAPGLFRNPANQARKQPEPFGVGV